MSPEGSQSANELHHRVSTVGVAAHELKSPLVLLRQLALELSRDDLSPTERVTIIEQMQHVSDKALRLTSDLTRIEAQSSLFSLEPVNPIDIAREVKTDLQSLYKAHGRSLRVKRINNLPPVIANRDLLRRVLSNFVDNALHYGDTNGAVELHAQLLYERAMVRLSVRDFGPHMSGKDWRRLVSTLNYGQPVHARPQSSGLGIYISSRFAERMNGKIGAIRHQDGASFYIELPVSNQLSLL